MRRRHFTSKAERNRDRRARRTRAVLHRAFQRAVDAFEIELGKTLARIRDQEVAA